MRKESELLLANNNSKMTKKNNFNDRHDAAGWNRSTELGCDLKTIISSDARMKTGKAYQGVLTRDSHAVVDEYLCRDAHYTFIETTQQAARRNPRVFAGQYVTVTRRPDGSLRPNFKPLWIDRHFCVDAFAIGVCNELRRALNGLVEE